jgi:hypothetical protein
MIVRGQSRPRDTGRKTPSSIRSTSTQPAINFGVRDSFLPLLPGEPSNEWMRAFSSQWSPLMTSSDIPVSKCVTRSVPSYEVINGDHWEENALIHSFDFDPTGNQLWGARFFPPSLACVTRSVPSYAEE